MKKEKTIRTYQRRTKSGKIVTVKQHTAKYDAAEKAKEAAKKKGAGNELEAKMKRLRLKELIGKELPEEEVEKKVLDEDEKGAKKKGKIRPVGTGTNGPEPKKASKEKASKTATSKSKKAESADSNSAFTAAEFKEWYHGTGSAADKKVAKALRAQLGRAGYRKLEDEAIDNYSSRGHLSMFKRVSGGSEVSAKTGKSDVKEKAVEAKTSKYLKEKAARKEAKEKVQRVKAAEAWTKSIRESSEMTQKVKEAVKSLRLSPDHSNHLMRQFVDAIDKDMNSPMPFRVSALAKKYGIDLSDGEPKKSGAKKSESKDTTKTGKSSSSVSKASKNATSGTKSAKVASETPKKGNKDLSSVSGQVSYVRKLSKELPEDKRKVLAPLLRRASTGQISTQSLWNAYQKLNSKSKRYKTQPAPWDKRAWSDMAHSD